MNEAPPSERTRVHRGAAKGRYDRDTVHSIVDSCLVGHVAFMNGDQPMCIPMLTARLDDEVLVHGSTASRLMKSLATGIPACVTFTVIHGLVLARSVFEHSANYDSVVALGRFRVVPPDEKLGALEVLTEKLLPGRWGEARTPNASELKATSILALPLSEASAKIRRGPPDDDDTSDAELDVWAGELPILARFGEPEPSPGLRAGIPIPESIRRTFTKGE